MLRSHAPLRRASSQVARPSVIQRGQRLCERPRWMTCVNSWKLVRAHENPPTVARLLEEAARWSSQGARTPGAHYLICAVAAAINEIAGKPMEARYWAEQSFARRKDASIEAFFAAFPFRDEKIRSDLRRALTALGFRN